VRRKLLLDFPWDHWIESDVEPLYEAWLALPEADRATVELSFREIDALACKDGIQLLVEEGQFHSDDLTEALGPLEGLHAKALFAFLHHAILFGNATRLLQAQSLSTRYWNKRNHLPRQAPNLSKEAILGLRAALSAYYRHNQGRGEHCTVEHYLRAGGQHYFFAYPDDYADIYLGHADGRLVRRPQRPAFQVVFVYDPEAGSLDLYAHGNRFLRADLQEIFAREILGQDLGPELPREHAYELNGLKSRSFAFPADLADGIAEVRVSRLRLSQLGQERRRLVLEGDPKRGPHDVYDMLDAWVPEAVVPRSLFNVTQVTLSVRLVEVAANGRPKALTFNVSYPDACTLKSQPEELRLLGEKYLKRWGINRE
jgi:hypothetical protein